jgi:dihydrofolate reductase
MINCVVAVERNQGIGFNGQMPWPHLRGDMAWFKQLTTGHIIIMGSTTWKSLPKALPNRVNVVISKNNVYSEADHCFTDIDLAIESCKNQYPKKEIFIIGGQSIYDQCMNIIERFFVTDIDATYTCDKFFNFGYVKENFSIVIEHVKHHDIIPYQIKEYRK